MDTKEQKVDGRHERLVRSKLAVLQAVNDIVRETGEAPTADTLSKRSGVSRRSIFRIFGSKSGLLKAAAEFMYDELVERFPFPDLADLAPSDRIARFVDHIGSIYEYMAPFARVSRKAQEDEELILRERMRIQALYQSEVRGAFASFGKVAAAAPVFRDSAQLLLSWNAWDYLRNERKHSVEHSKTILTQTILALLHQHGLVAE